MAYAIYPDDTEVDVTPQAGAPMYSFPVPVAGKFLSHLEVFVRQPWPNWPNDGFNNDPNDPFYNPSPLGYPIVNGFDTGHTWWELATEAPGEAVLQFANGHAPRWRNTEVGFGPETDVGLGDVLYAILHAQCPTTTGQFPCAEANPRKDVTRTYAIGFPGLIAGLNHCEDIYWNTPTFDLCDHNCVTETRITGSAAGISLPNVWHPEGFGFDLPPSDP